MTSKNLSVCFGPTLLATLDLAAAMKNISAQNKVVAGLIDHHSVVFSSDDGAAGSETVEAFVGHRM